VVMHIKLSGPKCFKSTKVKRGRIDTWIRFAELSGVTLFQSNLYMAIFEPRIARTTQLARTFRLPQRVHGLLS